MLELHHNEISTCSQKVRLVLAEKGLEFESHVVNLLEGQQHDPAYVKLNPNHVVPTLVDDGAVYIESTLINEYLEDRFPEVAMLPADPGARHAARLWGKKVDTVHPSAGVLTYAIGPRKMILQQPDDVREANINSIPDPARRAVRRSVIEHGVKAPEFAAALGAFISLIDAMEERLATNEWVSGDLFGLADAATMPYVLRLDHLAMAPLLSADVRPRVADWFARVQARPSYARAVTEWVPDFIVDLMRANGQEVWPEVEPLTR